MGSPNFGKTPSSWRLKVEFLMWQTINPGPSWDAISGGRSCCQQYWSVHAWLLKKNQWDQDILQQLHPGLLDPQVGKSPPWASKCPIQLFIASLFRGTGSHKFRQVPIFRGARMGIWPPEICWNSSNLVYSHIIICIHTEILWYTAFRY